MKLIQKVTEDEVVSVFLKSEFASDRFKKRLAYLLKKYTIETDIITDPNLVSKEENKIRRKLIAEFRGWGSDKKIFGGFPKDIQWYKAILNKEELLDVRYINWDYWLEITNDTRSPTDAVETINNDIEVYGESNKMFLEVARTVK